MYVLIRQSAVTGEADYFGPFPTEERASEYSESFETNGAIILILPLIVPNCITVQLNY